MATDPKKKPKKPKKGLGEAIRTYFGMDSESRKSEAEKRAEDKVRKAEDKAGIK